MCINPSTLVSTSDDADVLDDLYQLSEADAIAAFDYLTLPGWRQHIKREDDIVKKPIPRDDIVEERIQRDDIIGVEYDDIIGVERMKKRQKR